MPRGRRAGSAAGSGALVAVLLAAGCAPASEAIRYPAPIAASSETLTVTGRYEPVALDSVERLALEDGRLVLHGATANVAVDLPPGADPSRPGRGWALVTETSAGDARELTFIHNQLLDEFTIRVPDSTAPVRYGSIAGQGGTDVVLLAWGAGSESFWGYVIVERR